MHVCDRNTFWILSLRICADSCSCTEQLFQLAWVAINRGLTPVAPHLLAGAHPNLLSSKCNVINLSHTHNNQTLSLINTIRMSSNSTHCFSQRNDRNQCAQLSTSTTPTVPLQIMFPLLYKQTNVSWEFVPIDRSDLRGLEHEQLGWKPR